MHGCRLNHFVDLHLLTHTHMRMIRLSVFTICKHLLLFLFTVDFMSFWSVPTLWNALKDPVMPSYLLNVLWKALKPLVFFLSCRFIINLLLFFSSSFWLVWNFYLYMKLIQDKHTVACSLFLLRSKFGSRKLTYQLCSCANWSGCYALAINCSNSCPKFEYSKT